MFTHFSVPLSDTKLYNAKHLFSMFLCSGLADMDSKTELRTYVCSFMTFSIFL